MLEILKLQSRVFVGVSRATSGVDLVELKDVIKCADGGVFQRCHDQSLSLSKRAISPINAHPCCQPSAEEYG